MADKPKGEKGFDIEEDLSKVEIPDVLPVLPLRGIVIFPNQIHPFLVSRASSLKLIEDVGQTQKIIALAAQKNPEEESPRADGLFQYGTAVQILKMLALPGSERSGAGAGNRANRADRLYPGRAIFYRTRDPRGRSIRARQGNRSAARASGEPVLEVRFARAVPARRVAGAGDEGARAGTAGRHGRVVPEDCGRGIAGSARHG